jgi:hypothetical protein
MGGALGLRGLNKHLRIINHMLMILRKTLCYKELHAVEIGRLGSPYCEQLFQEWEGDGPLFTSLVN